MDITEELDALSSSSNPSCIEWLVRKHGEEQREVIEKAFNHPKASSHQKVAVLRSRGIATSAKTIQTHMRGDCAC